MEGKSLGERCSSFYRGQESFSLSGLRGSFHDLNSSFSSTVQVAKEETRE